MQPFVVWVLFVANAIVFGMWLWLGPSPLMVDNFLVSWNGVVEGRYWTLLASAFSHMGFLHFFVNMYVLTSFGAIVEQTIGAGRFIRFYLTAAVLSSLCHAAVSAFLLSKPELPALGASGAVSGVVLLFAFIYPRAQLLLFGIVPMPALFGALLFVGIDVAGLIAQTEGGGLPIGHGAHLGGAAVGALYYLFVLRHRLRESRSVVFDFSGVENWRAFVAQSLGNEPRRD